MRCIAVCIIHRGLRYLFQGYGKSISSGKAIREQQQCSSSNICLIPFKAKAWLDLKERKLNGDQVDSKNIKKHKNDVFRLAQLITVNTRQVLNSEIAEDMKKFLSEIADETVDLKSLGIRGTDKQKIIDMLYLCYNLNDNT